MDLTPTQKRLILDHLYLVDQAVRRVLPQNREDAIQDGRIGLVQAAQRWDGESDFVRFARRRISGSMIDELRKRTNFRRSDGWIPHSVSIDQYGVDKLQSSDDEFEADSDHRLDAEGLLNRMMEIVECQKGKSDPRTRVILIMLSEGRTQSEIAVELGITAGGVCLRVSDLRRRLHLAGLNPSLQSDDDVTTPDRLPGKRSTPVG